MAKVGVYLRGGRGKFAGGVLQKGADGGTILRELVKPSNPQSGQQSGQRMKLAPAQAFYRAFSSVLDHSWEGVPYGFKSRREFLSRALKSPAVAYYKNQRGLVPALYEISSGTLTKSVKIYDDPDTIIIELVRAPTSAEITKITTGRAAGIPVLRTLLGFGDDFRGQVTALLVDSFAGLVKGAMYEGSIHRLIFDESEDVVDDYDWFRDAIFSDINPDSNLVEIPDFYNLGFIVSEFKDGKWSRSNSSMYAWNSVNNLYYSEANVRDARRSYQKKFSADSEKYLNEGNGEED